MNRHKTVSEFLDDLETDKREQVEALRKIILSVNSDLTEHIKWNSPSYVYKGENRITFNLLNKDRVVKLVLHIGTGRKEDKKGQPVMDDATGMVDWRSDIRGVLSFSGLGEIEAKKDEVSKIVQDWLAIEV